MKTLGTDCTNNFCIIQIQCFKIVPSRDTMTQTEKSRIIRKKGQEIDRSKLGMNFQLCTSFSGLIPKKDDVAGTTSNPMKRNDQSLQEIFVVYKIRDNYFQGGILL